MLLRCITILGTEASQGLLIKKNGQVLIIAISRRVFGKFDEGVSFAEPEFPFPELILPLTIIHDKCTCYLVTEHMFGDKLFSFFCFRMIAGITDLL
jgi:hypothetical protein